MMEFWIAYMFWYTQLWVPASIFYLQPNWPELL